MASLQEIVSTLNAKKIGAEWYARCPAHHDGTPSLAITERNGSVLYHCHAGCTQDEVGSALSHVGVWGGSNRSLRPLSPLQRQNAKRKAHAPARRPQRERIPEHVQGKPVAYYDYVDENGELLYQVVRLDPKSFRQRRPDGKGGWIWSLYKYTTAGRELAVRLVPYRFPEVLEAEIVFIVEGEKDADTMWDMGFAATTNSMGAGNWLPEFNQHFAGKRVYTIPDHDEQGWRRAAMIARGLKGIAKRIALIELDDAKDITDWFLKGHSEIELCCLLEGSDAR
jgi:putative DNA primase/helicase